MATPLDPIQKALKAYPKALALLEWDKGAESKTAWRCCVQIYLSGNESDPANWALCQGYGKTQGGATRACLQDIIDKGYYTPPHKPPCARCGKESFSKALCLSHYYLAYRQAKKPSK